MAVDPAFESALEALLDGRRLGEPSSDTGDTPEALEPLRVMAAIARAHRVALFGEDAADADDSTSPLTRWGHLEVGDEIGRGATGTVYRAWDTRLSREVALKLLAREEGSTGDEALAEGRLLARLRHPHIVTVYGADVHDGVAGVWMELVRGDTLDEVLARDGTFGVEDALLVGIDIAGALAAVHAAGLLHRDVKARNVIRERGGRVLLMDLGAGRALDEAPAGGDGTGTPLYMAPEVLAGGAATERSDVHSLGVLLYRLLTRSYPVSASRLDALRDAHAAGSRTPLALLCPDLPAAATRAIGQACEPDPGRRTPSARDLERALRDALREAIDARAPVRSTAARRWARWRRTVAGAAAVAAAVSVTTWAAWGTIAVRGARRALGLPVPPRSPLYVATSGGLLIVRGANVQLVPGNPATAVAIAVSADLGIRTLAGGPPWIDGAAFGLDGTPRAAPRAAIDGVCCFSDGTTDGEFNYAIRQDSTLLEPIGSRRLAPSELYRFGRDWSAPVPAFRLTQSGTYSGVCFSAATGTFWAARNEPGTAVLEQWSRDGRLVASPVRTTPALAGVACDPADGTVWVVRQLPVAGQLRLENHDAAGGFLSTFSLSQPLPFLDGIGVEFAWPGRP